MASKIKNAGENLHSVGKDKIPPDPANMITALRQIGYTIEQSLSDLIDNSINAKSKNVLIRFLHDGKKIEEVLIADDGFGMTAPSLKEAMKFGSKQKNDGRTLGKYGMGLKVASLGYATSLTVLSRRGNFTGGRRWTVAGIADDWNCEQLEPAGVVNELKQPLGNVDLSDSGTLLIWSDVDRLKIGNAGLPKTLQKLTKRLSLHFGLCFHRYLESNKLNIRIDERLIGEDETGICTTVMSVNPFKYPYSGNDEFPKAYKADVPGVGSITVEAHIWPPNSKESEYKLGGKAAQRQGFYFYRNDRLIQIGGWNGIVENETEAHSSLARIVVNLPRGQDSQYGLNVQKSSIIVPPAFVEAMAKAESSDGDTLQGYRSAAQKTYRKDQRHIDTFPMIPNKGLPKELASSVKGILTGGKGRVRKVDIEWGDVKNGNLFDLDRAKKTIILNRFYRDDILAGKGKSQSDVPLFKILIFLLLKDDLDSGRSSTLQRERLKIINEMMIEAAQLRKG